MTIAVIPAKPFTCASAVVRGHHAGTGQRDPNRPPFQAVDSAPCCRRPSMPWRPPSCACRGAFGRCTCGPVQDFSRSPLATRRPRCSVALDFDPFRGNVDRAEHPRTLSAPMQMQAQQPAGAAAPERLAVAPPMGNQLHCISFIRTWRDARRMMALGSRCLKSRSPRRCRAGARLFHLSPVHCKPPMTRAQTGASLSTGPPHGSADGAAACRSRGTRRWPPRPQRRPSRPRRGL